MFQGNYLFIMKKDRQKSSSKIDGDCVKVKMFLQDFSLLEINNIASLAFLFPCFFIKKNVLNYRLRHHGKNISCFNDRDEK